MTAGATGRYIIDPVLYHEAMAYKKSRGMQRTSKIEPSVQTLSFVMTTAEPGINALDYIDLSQVASLVNRRFYRQGLNWAVAGFKFLRPAGYEGTVKVSKLPNTWVMSNAWEKGFRAWQRQQDEVLEDGEQESVRARFNDFKIYADGFHLTSGVAGNLLPISTVGTYVPGEWEYSQIVIPNYGAPGVNYEPSLTAVGDYVGGAGGSISLIKAYQNSRGVPQSPDPAVPVGVTNADNIWRALFDVGDNNEDVLANVVGKNNDLPYPQDEYPGGAVQGIGLQIHDLEYITPTTVGGTTRIKGGNFPCGLIQIESTNTGLAGELILQIDLIPGSHRGYLCEPMTEM